MFLYRHTAQGGSLSAFYQAQTATPPYAYDIAFLSPSTSGVQFCVNNGASTCTNDGNQFANGQLQANPASFTPKLKSRSMVPGYLYRTSSGQELSSASLFEIGREIHIVVVRNETLEAERLSGIPEAIIRAEADPEHYSFVKEAIVERLL